MSTEDEGEDEGFIGRKAILERLEGAMAGVEGSKGAFLLVAGEAGIGKTRLAEMAMGMARRRGWAVMSGECLFGEGGEPYFAIVRAISEYMTSPAEAPVPRGDGADLDAAPPSLPSSLMGLADEGGGAGAGAEERRSLMGRRNDLRMERDRMFETVTDILFETASFGPVLLAIDDLHWAEASTLQLLHYIVRMTRDERIMVLGTYRPEELEHTRAMHPMSDFLSRVGREGLVETFPLGSFDKGETADLVAAISASVPASVVSRIHEETGGNPFFITELVRAEGEGLDGRGAADVSGNSDSDGAIAIPSTVSAFIMDRVRRLRDEEQTLLEMGAVLGRTFRYDIILKASGMAEEAMVELLEGLCGKRLLEERDVGDEITYRFTHDIVRGVIYDRLSRTKRRLLHKKVADSMEAVLGAAPERAVFAMAYHYSHTTQTRKAFDYNLQAGGIALRNFAMEEAREHLEAALDLLQRMEDLEDAEAREADILMDLGMVYNFTGLAKEALECDNKALALTDEGSLARAKALRYIADVEMDMGAWSKALRTFEEAAAISRDLGDTRGEAEALRGIAWLSVEMGHHDEALGYMGKCLEKAREAGLNHIEGMVLIDIGNSYNIRNEHERALHYYEEALKVLDHSKHLDQLSRAYNNSGDVYMKMRDLDRAMDNFQNCLEIAKITGDIKRKGYGLLNISDCYRLMGRLDESEESLERTLPFLTRTEDRYGLAVLEITRARIARDRGDLGKAEVLMRKANNMASESEFRMLQVLTLAELGVILKRLGRRDEALDLYERALDIKDTIGTRLGRVQESLEELEGLRKG